jgi:hypothetical protein
MEAATTASSPSWNDFTILNRQLATDNPGGGNGNSIAGTSTAIGTGRNNTTLIVTFDPGISDSGTPSGAAVFCRNYAGGGFSGATTGWLMPSRDDLLQMYTQRTTIGGFSTVSGSNSTTYWSSSQFSLSTNYYVNFANGSNTFQTKGSTSKYRAIRYF